MQQCLGCLSKSLAAEKCNGEPLQELITVCLLNGCYIPPMDLRDTHFWKQNMCTKMLNMSCLMKNKCTVSYFINSVVIHPQSRFNNKHTYKWIQFALLQGCSLKTHTWNNTSGCFRESRGSCGCLPLTFSCPPLLSLWPDLKQKKTFEDFNELCREHESFIAIS